MTLRTIIGRALHAMTSTGAPRAWEDDPGVITTAQAAAALGLMADPSVAAMAARADNREVRLERDAAQAELADARRKLGDTQAALQGALDAVGVETRLRERLTRDVALRTTQRDKARSDRDRAVADRYQLQTQLDDVVRALALIVQAQGGRVSVDLADLNRDALTVQWHEDMRQDHLVFSTSPKAAPC